MVTITSSIVPLRMNTFELSDLFGYAKLKLEHTGDGPVVRYYDSVQDSANNQTSLLGAGLTVSNGQLSGGTVAIISAVKNGAAFFGMMGANLAATDLNIMIQSGDARAFWLATLSKADLIAGSPGSDILIGYGGGDVLLGEAGGDTLRGLSGPDRLFGGVGNDRLDGGNGNDRVNGGTDADTLYGGSGYDAFIFADQPGTNNADTIVDFAPADDTIELLADNFAGIAAPGSYLPANRFVTGTVALDSNDRIIYRPGSGVLRYDSDGNGPTEPVTFARVTPGLVLTSNDFLMIDSSLLII